MKNDKIERRFLIDEFPINSKVVFSEIYQVKQGFINLPEDSVEISLMRVGKDFCLRSQRSNNADSFETRISRKQFKELWPSTIGRRIVKVRNVMYFGNHIIYADIYKGNLMGLMIADVIFDSVKAEKIFKKPLWFGKEITDDLNYEKYSLCSQKDLQWT